MRAHAEPGPRPAQAPEPRRRRELRLFLRRLAALGVLLVALLVCGMVAFALVEHVSVAYGFVWSLDTISTVGSITAPHDAGGQAIKVVLIVFGVGTLFYGLVAVTEFFVAGELTGLLEERRMQKRIDALSDHYLICGFGRVGRQAVRDLRGAGSRFVVIDSNPENRELALDGGVPFIEGAPSDDEVLRQAGIDRARAVIACVDSDAENIFITLTARQLRPDVRIVARASVEDSERKMLRVGADRVISPYKASGSEMARLALHPQVSGAVAVASAEYRMEEIEVTAGCSAASRTIGDIRGGALIVALRRADGTFQPQPPAEAVLGPGDVLVALGTPETMDRLEPLFEPTATAGA